MFTDQVDKLNAAIEKYFSDTITRISPKYKIKFSGISRLIMLDRYSHKDAFLISLEVGDLVLVVVKDDPYFPLKGVGRIEKIEKDICLVRVEKDFLNSVDPSELVDGNKIWREKTCIAKPLEIFFEQIADRVAKNISTGEINDDEKAKYSRKFFNEIANLRYIPAGRILYGAGARTKVTFFNCFVLPFIHDSRTGLAKHRQKVMEIMSRGGGVGTNGSTLRPKGVIAKQVGGHSSGAVSWLNDLSQLTHLIQQGGSRRGAQMIILADWHPDVIELIISKMQNPKILEYLALNGKDERIKAIAKNKITLKPIDEKTKIAFECLLNDEENKSRISDIQEREIQKILKDGGEYIVNNPEHLEGANISIAISDKFMTAVKNNQMWDFRFPDLESYNEKQKQYYDEHWQDCGDVEEWETKHKMRVKTHFSIRASVFWDLINFCATHSAEPGLFFIDRANLFTNATAYGQKVIATNPCGEQPLPAYSVCNLGAINLEKFINRKTKEVMWGKLEKTIRISVRFQDNVIDETPYFLEENRRQALGERRIGIGVMGLHDLLIWSGHVYGSKESLHLLNKLFQFIAETAYDESANIAFEKGEFPFLKNNREKFINTEYCKQLPQKIRAKILAQGIRNSHLLTIAPTGTTGTMMGVSTGLEPYFGFTYYRSGRLGKSIKVSARIVKNYMKMHKISSEKDLPESFIIANELSPKQHVDVQITIQKWIDSAISKTVNAPKGFTVKQVESIYQTLYENNAKGGTVYVDGSRNSQVLNLSEEDVNFKEKQTTLSLPGDELINNKKIPPIEKSLRGNRLDKPIGSKIGNICPLCLEGTIVRINGCNTCTNCLAQLSCDV